MIDQMLLYDQAVVTWLNDTLPPLLKGRTTQILVATAQKSYAEVTTARLADNETLILPRISVTRLDYTNDPMRYNFTRIRRLGWDTTLVERAMRGAAFPVPVTIMYQVDLWTRFVKDMNLWAQKIMFDFASQYIYLNIALDAVWGTKMFPLFLEGGISDNSDLEPGEGDRVIRRTFSLRADAWIFDQAYEAVGIVKAMEFSWLDFDSEVEFDYTFLPPKEAVAVGDGIVITFNVTLVRPPVLEHAFILQAIIAGTIEHVQDDGAGNLLGDRVAVGTINYTTGAVAITFTVAPDPGENIIVTYFTDLS